MTSFVLIALHRCIVIVLMFLFYDSVFTRNLKVGSTYFKVSPKSQAVLEGGNVTLECVLANDTMSGRVVWVKDGVWQLDRQSRLNYSISKDKEILSVYKRILHNVTQEDEGEFRCRFLPDSTAWEQYDSTETLSSEAATVTVETLPGLPVILQGSILTAEEGTIVRLDCESSGGKPAPGMHWLDGRRRRISSGVVTKVTEKLAPKSKAREDDNDCNHEEQNQDSNRTILVTSSSLLLPVSKWNDSEVITCQIWSKNKSMKQLRQSSNVQLNIHFAPEVKMEILGQNDNNYENDDAVYEFENVSIVCRVLKANPSDVTFSWFVNVNGTSVLVPIMTAMETVVELYQEIGNDSQPDGLVERLELLNVTRAVNGSIFKCQVNNSIGISEKTDVLEIKSIVMSSTTGPRSPKTQQTVDDWQYPIVIFLGIGCVLLVVVIFVISLWDRCTCSWQVNFFRNSAIEQLPGIQQQQSPINNERSESEELKCWSEIGTLTRVSRNQREAQESLDQNESQNSAVGYDTNRDLDEHVRKKFLSSWINELNSYRNSNLNSNQDFSPEPEPELDRKNKQENVYADL